MGRTVTQFETGLLEVFHDVGGEGLEDVGFYCELQMFAIYYTHTHTHTHTYIAVSRKRPTPQMSTGGFNYGMLRVMFKLRN